MDNLKQYISDIFRGDKRLAIPIMTHPGIEYIGATVRQAVTDGKVHFEAIKALNDRFHPAATTVIMDLTVEAEAFGATVVFPEHEIPTVTGRLLEDEEAIDRLQVPAVNSGRVPEYLKANKLAVDAFRDKPVFSGCIGPYSLAGRLYDMSEFMMLCYTDEEPAKKLLQKCTDFLLAYCRELKKSGTDGVMIAEPAAGLLSNEGCEEFSSYYVKQIVDALQDESFIVILHNCGNSGHCTEAMLATGAGGYHFGNKANMIEILKSCPAGVLVMGNLDPVSLFKSATAAEMKAATLDLLNKTKCFNNYILSSGCDTPPHVPEANIAAFYEALKEYNQQ